jgi:hypothetical protein
MRHCERSEAIRRAVCGSMDCFVAALLAKMGMWSGFNQMITRNQY